MKRTIATVAVVSLALAAAVRGQSGDDPITNLTNIKTLTCVFPAGTAVTWAKDGTPRTRANDGPALTVRIAKINPSEGTAELIAPYEAEAIVQLYGWNLHIMEASREGRMLITTVFAKESHDRKLKAVHTRTDFLPLPGNLREPEATQYYGDCEVGR